jgi:hypothetical protein
MKKSNLPAILGGKPILKKPYHLVKPIFPPILENISGDHI